MRMKKQVLATDLWNGGVGFTRFQKGLCTMNCAITKSLVQNEAAEVLATDLWNGGMLDLSICRNAHAQ